MILLQLWFTSEFQPLYCIVNSQHWEQANPFGLTRPKFISPQFILEWELCMCSAESNLFFSPHHHAARPTQRRCEIFWRALLIAQKSETGGSAKRNHLWMKEGRKRPSNPARPKCSVLRGFPWSKIKRTRVWGGKELLWKERRENGAAIVQMEKTILNKEWKARKIVYILAFHQLHS